MALSLELQTYSAKKDSLIEQGHLGKFVVIKNEEIFDVFLTYEDALRQGLKRYGNVPFLIKEITEFERINFFYHGIEGPCQASA